MRKGTVLYGNYLEPYRVIEHITNGGNSEVYKVEDATGDLYALKLLNRDLSTEKIKRFKNEMSFCIKTNHPNIIKIIDNGITDNKTQIFYIMPYYARTLRDYINENHDFEENIQVFITLLNGVNFFHKKKIIHRDLKPENILLTNENFPIISDFGIAHFSTDELITQIETRVGSRMANFQYAAPEQRERNGIITNRTDIFALGLIFNELFTKKVPTGAAYKKVSNIDIKYSFLDNVIDRMIAQNPDDRYPEVEDIIYEVKTLIKIKEKEIEIEKLNITKYPDKDEDDILILEPPRLKDFQYNETTGKLSLYLDKSVNNTWIQCMTEGTYGALYEFGPEKFTLENNIAEIYVPSYYLDSLQKIIDYFKSWINNANSRYPAVIKNKREQEKRKKEKELKEKILKEEKIKKVLENIHI